MEKLLTVGFEFCEKLYYSLIRVRKKNGYNEYKITVMNGDLEKLLYGNNIITELQGCLEIEIVENSKQCVLKYKIAEALSKLLSIPLAKKLQF